MIDIGFSKLLLVGGIALVVIGPERLPRVARTLGTLLGRAQRYVAEVKAEVNRSIELESLNKVRQEFETAARDVEQSIDGAMTEAADGLGSSFTTGSSLLDTPEISPAYLRPNKKWRIKRGALPQWYKRRQGVRTRVQSAAARVARHRPPGIGPRG